jgi:hypothetical protein
MGGETAMSEVANPLPTAALSGEISGIEAFPAVATEQNR